VAGCQQPPTAVLIPGQRTARVRVGLLD
jgi:hypothetical protein